EIRPGSFAPPENFDAYAYLMRRFADFPGRWEVEIWIGASQSEAKRVVGPEDGIVTPVEESDGGPPGVIFRGRFDDLDQLALRLSAVRKPIVVRKPPELRDALRALSVRLAQMADSTG
ncbi:MAG TPA: WYL domain-containing protein, partial [Thermomicrobiaceae bacterium]|nr:WYL domain-containing protein [Thermomicrobiaceae bacterium]